VRHFTNSGQSTVSTSLEVVMPVTQFSLDIVLLETGTASPRLINSANLSAYFCLVMGGST